VTRSLIVAGVCLQASLAVAAPVHIQKFDTNHSTIAFRVPILGGMSEVEGKFTDFARA
jgi:polyisoprenoid-binding protein YceI